MTENTNPNGAWPYFEQDEIDAVVAVLQSGRVNSWTGNITNTFETEFATHMDSKYGIAVANGTLALELALRACGIKEGDEVVVPARTFIATASAVVAVGATPVVCDVDLISQNMKVETVTPCLSDKTKAIIPVHLAGWPCDMNAICKLANQKGLIVIEDCAQAHGASIDGQSVGSFGDMAIFSFCQDKIMTTGGDGGMLVTSNESLAVIAREYKDHGKSFEKIKTNKNTYQSQLVHDRFGTNYRMTEMQAAIGQVQLKKLSDWVSVRNQNADVLKNAFSKIPQLRVETPPSNIYHAYYKFYAFLKLERLNKGINRQQILEELNNLSVKVSGGICPDITKEKAFTTLKGNKSHDLINAAILGESSLMFQVHHTLTKDNMNHIVDALTHVLDKSAR